MKISQYAFLLAATMIASKIRCKSRYVTHYRNNYKRERWHIDGWIQRRVETRKKKKEVKPQIPGSGLEVD